MKNILVIVAIVVILIAHQDYWSVAQWERKDLVFGFLPYTIAYHAVISILAALIWIFVCFACWPKELDEIETEKREPSKESSASKGAQA